MAAVHAEHGVEPLARDQVVRFEGRGRVERAVTRAGRTLSCDFAVVAVGIQPNVELLPGSGVAVDNGVLVDSMCRTSRPDVFAAGDVADQLHPLFGRTRVEHYNNAEKQDRWVAGTMLGSEQPYDYLHTFWSDQYDQKLEHAGEAKRWDAFVIRGSLEARQAHGFHLVDGVVGAVVGLNSGGDPEIDLQGEMAAAPQLIKRRASVSERDLADGSQDLARL